MEDQPSKRLGYLHRMMMMVVMNYDEGEEMKDHIEPLASDVLASLERFLKEKKDELSPQDLRNAGRVLKSLRRLPSLSPLCSKHTLPLPRNGISHTNTGTIKYNLVHTAHSLRHGGRGRLLAGLVRDHALGGGH